MSISVTPPLANLFLPPAAGASISPAAQATTGLRPEQLLRALVVAKGSKGAILELAGERFRALSSRPLSVGQVLELRILQTSGRVEALVLNNELQDRLARRLPLLARPFDWSGLLERLQQPGSPQPLRPAEAQIVRQLQQLLDPAGKQFQPLKEGIEQLAGQLRALRLPLAPNSLPSSLPPVYRLAQRPAAGADQLSDLARRTAEPFSLLQSSDPAKLPGPLPGAATAVPAAAVNAELQQVQQLLGRLQQQLALAVDVTRPVSRTWQNATIILLQHLQQRVDAVPLRLLPQPELTATLERVQQHPQAPVDVSRQAGQLLVQLQNATALFELRPTPAPDAGIAGAKEGSGTVSLPKEQIALLQQVTEGIRLLQHVVGGSSTEGVRLLPPALLGRFEGVMDLLTQLQDRDNSLPALPAALPLVAAQLQQLATASVIPARGETLGFLSQFFGLQLERELLYDKQKTALNNLKQSLLTLQQTLGEEVREPLNRIELFQLCRARFAELQMQFLPLPFADLEEGYLLADQRESAGEKRSEGEKSLQLSLSLRLSALGNMRVDLQFDAQQGLVMQLACEDRRKMDYVRSCSEDLAAVVTSVQLKEVHYSADALHPVQQLQQRLLPQHRSLLDTRA